MTLSLSERLRKAADTRFQLAVYDDAGRHAVKDDVLAAADLIEAIDQTVDNRDLDWREVTKAIQGLLREKGYDV